MAYKKILKSAGLIVVGLFVVLFVVRTVHFYNLDKTALQVEKIHNTKLTMDDVLGKNLPPDPGMDADKTIQGADANKNGIRDDVELAIFKQYPNSAKTRAVLLQYALVLQKETTVSIINADTATALGEEDSRAYDCIGTIVPKSNDDIQKIESYRNWVNTKQLNTSERKNKKENLSHKVKSFKLQYGCDIDYLNLSN